MINLAKELRGIFLLAAQMSTDELTILFYSELKEDLVEFRRLIDQESLSMLYAFAHKYKVRLEYFGYTACYELCLGVERYYKEEEKQVLLNHALDLYLGLKTIREKNK